MKMKDKMISVIIPIYNSEKYLRECLSSVAGQTYRNLEIILIDDGSTDGSLEICKEFVESDLRFHIASQKNSGVAAARNLGLALATGEFVLFVDSDDMLLPGICEIAIEKIQEYDVLLFEHVEGQQYQNSNAMPQIKPEIISLENYSVKDYLSSLLGKNKTIPVKSSLNTVWGKLYRRSFLTMHQINCPVGIFIGEDVIMNLRVFLAQPKCCSLPHVGYFYRYNPASEVHRYNGKIRESYVLFLSEINYILDEKRLLEAFWYEAGFQQVYSLFQIFSVDIFHPDNPKLDHEKREDFFKLISEEGVCAQITAQQKNFGFLKWCVLTFAKNKWYSPLKVMYWMKQLIKK